MQRYNFFLKYQNLFWQKCVKSQNLFLLQCVYSQNYMQVCQECQSANFCKVNIFPERNFQVYEMFPEREFDDQFTHHLSRCSLRMDNLRQYALAMDQVCMIPKN